MNMALETKYATFVEECFGVWSVFNKVCMLCAKMCIIDSIRFKLCNFVLIHVHFQLSRSTKAICTEYVCRQDKATLVLIQEQRV